MYRHTSKLIKLCANIVAILGIAASIALGLLLFGSHGITLFGDRITPVTTRILGVVVIVAGIILSWVLGLLMHGFGELLEKTKDNNYLLSRIASHTKEMHDQSRS